MRVGGRALFSLVLLGGFGLASGLYLTAPHPMPATSLPDHAPDLANGERLFNAGGCASCHAAPGARGQERLVLAGGMALQSPFGTFHAPNISPSSEGIGGWSSIAFVNAMTRGISPDGRHYYPAFPYTSYQRMRLEDLIDLKAFLDTLPVDSTPSLAHDLPFPFTIRRGLGLWKRLYLDGEPFRPDPGASDRVNRGAYLVEGPGHCQECHTPRTILGGRLSERAFSGAANPDGDGRIPNITPHAEGIGAWSEDDIAYALESGFTPEFDSLGGSMGAVVTNFSHLTDEDRRAVAAYLKSLPPLPTSRP